MNAAPVDRTALHSSQCSPLDSAPRHSTAVDALEVCAADRVREADRAVAASSFRSSRAASTLGGSVRGAPGRTTAQPSSRSWKNARTRSSAAASGGLGSTGLGQTECALLRDPWRCRRRVDSMPRRRAQLRAQRREPLAGHVRSS